MSSILLSNYADEEAPITLYYPDIKSIKTSLYHAEVIYLDGRKGKYHVGIDGVRRLNDWMLKESCNADPGQLQTVKAVMTDLITHGPNLLEAMSARIAKAVIEDREQAHHANGQPSGPLDSNASYWKHEREVVERLIGQATRVLGQDQG